MDKLALDQAGRAVGAADHCKICLFIVVLVASIGSKGLLRQKFPMSVQDGLTELVAPVLPWRGKPFEAQSGPRRASRVEVIADKSVGFELIGQARPSSKGDVTIFFPGQDDLATVGEESLSPLTDVERHFGLRNSSQFINRPRVAAAMTRIEDDKRPNHFW